MSPILLLTGLLALAYFGTMLVEGRSLRGFGLPSGTEFLLVGVLIGPRFMGLISSSGLAGFEGLTSVALAWLALVTGAHYGFSRGLPVPRRRMLFGVALAVLAVVLTGAATMLVALLVSDLGARDLVLLALGVGAVSAETTRHAVRWVTERYGAKGPLASLIHDVTEADEAVPIGVLAVVAVLAPHHDALALSFPAWAALLATLGIGAAMGATCAALFDIEPRTSQRWGIVVGTGLLTVGASMRLGLSGVATTFIMGVVAASLSRQRATFEALMSTTERAVMLPALVLAGAYVTFPGNMPFVPIAIAAIAARIGAKLLAGRLLLRSLGVEHANGIALGIGLMPAGVLSITAGFVCALTLRGPVGDIILSVAAIHAILGELLGPTFLRRALRVFGDITDPSAETPRPAVFVPAHEPHISRSARLRLSDRPARMPARPSSDPSDGPAP